MLDKIYLEIIKGDNYIKMNKLLTVQIMRPEQTRKYGS